MSKRDGNIELATEANWEVGTSTSTPARLEVTCVRNNWENESVAESVALPEPPVYQVQIGQVRIMNCNLTNCHVKENMREGEKYSLLNQRDLQMRNDEGLAQYVYFTYKPIIKELDKEFSQACSGADRLEGSVDSAATGTIVGITQIVNGYCSKFQEGQETPTEGYVRLSRLLAEVYARAQNRNILTSLWGCECHDFPLEEAICSWIAITKSWLAANSNRTVILLVPSRDIMEFMIKWWAKTYKITPFVVEDPKTEEEEQEICIMTERPEAYPPPPSYDATFALMQMANQSMRRLESLVQDTRVERAAEVINRSWERDQAVVPSAPPSPPDVWTREDMEERRLVAELSRLDSMTEDRERQEALKESSRSSMNRSLNESMDAIERDLARMTAKTEEIEGYLNNARQISEQQGIEEGHLPESAGDCLTSGDARRRMREHLQQERYSLMDLGIPGGSGGNVRSTKEEYNSGGKDLIWGLDEDSDPEEYRELPRGASVNIGSVSGQHTSAGRSRPASPDQLSVRTPRQPSRMVTAGGRPAPQKQQSAPSQQTLIRPAPLIPGLSAPPTGPRAPMRGAAPPQYEELTEPAEIRIGDRRIVVIPTTSAAWQPDRSAMVLIAPDLAEINKMFTAVRRKISIKEWIRIRGENSMRNNTSQQRASLYALGIEILVPATDELFDRIFLVKASEELTTYNAQISAIMQECDEITVDLNFKEKLPGVSNKLAQDFIAGFTVKAFLNNYGVKKLNFLVCPKLRARMILELIQKLITLSPGGTSATVVMEIPDPARRPVRRTRFQSPHRVVSPYNQESGSEEEDVEDPASTPLRGNGRRVPLGEGLSVSPIGYGGSPTDERNPSLGRVCRGKDRRARAVDWRSYDPFKWPCGTQPIPNTYGGHSFVPLVHEANYVQDPEFLGGGNPPEWMGIDKGRMYQTLKSPTAGDIGSWRGIGKPWKTAYLARAHDAHRETASTIIQGLDNSYAVTPESPPSRVRSWSPGMESSQTISRPSTPELTRRARTEVQQQASLILSGSSLPGTSTGMPGMTYTLSDMINMFPAKKDNENACEYLRRIKDQVPVETLRDPTVSRSISNKYDLHMDPGQTLQQLLEAYQPSPFADDEKDRIDKIVKDFNIGQMTIRHAVSKLVGTGASPKRIAKALSEMNSPEMIAFSLKYPELSVEERDKKITYLEQLRQVNREVRQQRKTDKVQIKEVAKDKAANRNSTVERKNQGSKDRNQDFHRVTPSSNQRGQNQERQSATARIQPLNQNQRNQRQNSQNGNNNGFRNRRNFTQPSRDEGQPRYQTRSQTRQAQSRMLNGQPYLSKEEYAALTLEQKKERARKMEEWKKNNPLVETKQQESQ